MSSPARAIVLAINIGSSSVKFSLFEMSGEFEVKGEMTERRLGQGVVSRMEDVFSALSERAGRGERGARPTVVGHRIVHGGPFCTKPVRVDAELVSRLEALVPLAPLHLPPALRAIEAVGARYPDVPQIACFDTGFHASMPEIARRLPLPRELHEEGVRRYGFHGLSYEYVMSTLGENVPSRIVIAHLGNGSSLVAVKDGRAIDTTMGFTPAGGVLMGTRTGDLDPGVLVYLARQKGLTPDAMEHLVDRESGLLAVGGTSDMKELVDRARKEPRARLAIEMFGYGVRKAIGALGFALGGIDLLVFTGGIGENAPWVRAEACRGLDSFGIALDSANNARSASIVSTATSPCTVRVIATQEDVVIARHAVRINYNRGDLA